MEYIDKMKHITQKAPNIMDNELFDKFFWGLYPAIFKKGPQKGPKYLLKNMSFC